MLDCFAKPEYLYRLARSGSPQDRQELASAMQNMLGSPYRVIAQEILLLLLREAEQDLRLKLAEKLSTQTDCPVELIRFLVYENPVSIAQIAIKNSPLLQDEDLLKIVHDFGTDPDYTSAIAQRHALSPAIVDTLLKSEDQKTYLCLLNNQDIHFNEQCLTHIADVVKTQPDLQQSFLQRREVTPALAAQLYWHVSMELRQYILKHFPIEANKLDHSMEIVMQDQVELKKASMFSITDDVRAKAERLRATGALNVKYTVEALRNGNVPLFVCMAAILADVNDEKLLDSLEANEKNEPLSALAHLMRLNKNDFNGLYLLWRRHMALQKMTYAQEVADAFDCFVNMTRERLRYLTYMWVN